MKNNIFKDNGSIEGGKEMEMVRWGHRALRSLATSIKNKNKKQACN